MFTGIVEELGQITEIKQESVNSIILSIHADVIMTDIKIGDSIAVNGVCLTVTSFTKNTFQVDVMPETIKATSLKSLKTGSAVNLERAMPANGRFGGHFVSGHVDAIGRITRKKKESNAIYYDIEIPQEYQPYVLSKGSIAIDGVSLTIFNVKKQTVTMSLIPHTVEQTVLGEKGLGSIVNIECDMLAKYVSQMIEITNDNTITKKLLSENGYI